MNWITAKKWDEERPIMKIFLAKFFFILIPLFSFRAIAQMPDTHYVNAIAYVAGGIGSEESTAIEMESRQWPLMLQFSQVDEKGWGVWISDIQVKIINSKNQEIFSAICDGPMMLINLAPGQYDVLGTYEGRAHKRPILIEANKPQKLSIFWK